MQDLDFNELIRVTGEELARYETFYNRATTIGLIILIISAIPMIVFWKKSSINFWIVGVIFGITLMFELGFLIGYIDFRNRKAEYIKNPERYVYRQIVNMSVGD